MDELTVDVFGKGEQLQIERGDGPLVFMLQPTHYEVVGNERLDEWETLLRDRVGIADGVEYQPRGQPSISWCPGLDDCDEIGRLE